jgi:chromosome segregation ATPase
MGLFSKKPTLAEMEELRAELAAMRERLSASEAVAARHESVIAAAPDDELRAHLTHLHERLTASDGEARLTAERLAATEQRMTEVGTELANQLRELSSDIDALADAPSGPQKTPDEVVEALRSGQARLASEQARYQIAFRDDLAVLAEQVRRLAGR